MYYFTVGQRVRILPGEPDLEGKFDNCEGTVLKRVFESDTDQGGIWEVRVEGPCSYNGVFNEWVYGNYLQPVSDSDGTCAPLKVMEDNSTELLTFVEYALPLLRSTNPKIRQAGRGLLEKALEDSE